MKSLTRNLEFESTTSKLDFQFWKRKQERLEVFGAEIARKRVKRNTQKAVADDAIEGDLDELKKDNLEMQEKEQKRKRRGIAGP